MAPVAPQTRDASRSAAFRRAVAGGGSGLFVHHLLILPCVAAFLAARREWIPAAICAGLLVPVVIVLTMLARHAKGRDGAIVFAIVALAFAGVFSAFAATLRTTRPYAPVLLAAELFLIALYVAILSRAQRLRRR